MNVDALDMLNDDEIAAYLVSRGWACNEITSPDGTSVRRLLWSPWQKTPALVQVAG